MKYKDVCQEMNYRLKEQDLDKTKDEIAMRIGYHVLEIRNLLRKYEEAEKEFAKSVGMYEEQK